MAVEADELAHGLLRTQLMRLWPHDRPSPDEAQLRALSARYLAGHDVRALAAIRRSNRAQVVSDDMLAAVRVPILGIVGSEDPYLAQFRELQPRMQDMTLVVIAAARHDDAAGRPEFLHAVQDFLAAHR